MSALSRGLPNASTSEHSEENGPPVVDEVGGPVVDDVGGPVVDDVGGPVVDEVGEPVVVDVGGPVVVVGGGVETPTKKGISGVQLFVSSDSFRRLLESAQIRYACVPAVAIHALFQNSFSVPLGNSLPVVRFLVISGPSGQIPLLLMSTQSCVIEFA